MYSRKYQLDVAWYCHTRALVRAGGSSFSFSFASLPNSRSDFAAEREEAYLHFDKPPNAASDMGHEEDHEPRLAAYPTSVLRIP